MALIVIGNVFSDFLGILFSISARLFEIGKILGSLPFSSVTRTVFRSKSMSIHFNFAASPHHIPVSLSNWKTSRTDLKLARMPVPQFVCEVALLLALLGPWTVTYPKMGAASFGSRNSAPRLEKGNLGTSQRVHSFFDYCYP